MEELTLRRRGRPTGYWKDEQRKEKKRADRLAKAKALRDKRERERVHETV